MMSSKGLKIILAFILVFIIVMLTGVLIYALSGHSLSFNQKVELLASEEYQMKDVKNINVYSKEANVKFIVLDTETIKVSVYGNEKREATIDLQNETMNVHYDSAFMCFGFCSFHSYIEVVVPKNYQENVHVSTVSGDVNLPTFAAKNLDVKTVSGNITLGAFEKIKVTSTSGDIKIASAHVLDAKSVSGEIFSTYIKDSLRIQTTSGDVEISNASLINDSEIKTVSGDVSIDRINDIYVDTKTISGDVDIKNNNRLANVVLSVETTSGDIEVN